MLFKGKQIGFLRPDLCQFYQILFSLYKMKKVPSSTKTIINGDYYQLNKSGIYQRHQDVSVHCHDPNNLQVPLHSQSSHIPPSITTNSNPPHQSSAVNPQQRSQTSQPQIIKIKSPFLQNCKKILQKQQVNSIHQGDTEDGKQVQKPASFLPESHKNPRMRRSTNNQLNLKKGILKHSMFDKYDKYDGKPEPVQKNRGYKMDRSVRIDGNLSHREHELQAMLQKQYEAIGQRHYSVSSVEEERRASYGEGNAQYRGNSGNKGMESRGNAGNDARTARPREMERRLMTQGRDTVENNYGNGEGYSNDEDRTNLHENFSKAVFSQIKFLKQRFHSLQNQLKQNEQKLKIFQLQQTLQQKKVQIQQLSKQNQILKAIPSPSAAPASSFPSHPCSHPHSHSHQPSQLKFELEPLLQLVEQKATFIISFLVVLFLCVLVGRTGGTGTCKA